MALYLGLPSSYDEAETKDGSEKPTTQVVDQRILPAFAN